MPLPKTLDLHRTMLDVRTFDLSASFGASSMGRSGTGPTPRVPPPDFFGHFMGTELLKSKREAVVTFGTLAMAAARARA